MKKILIFKPLISVGGAEVAMLNLVKFLKGYEIYVGYSDFESQNPMIEEFSEYVKVNHISNLLDFEFDFLILATTHYHTIPEFRNLKYKYKYLWFHYFSDLNKSVFTNLDELNNLDGIISVSNATTRKIINIFPFLEEKIITIYNLIDCNRVLHDSTVPIELELSNELNLVTTARISVEKGFYRMAMLAKFLKKANINFKWFIIGDADDEKAQHLKSLFDEYKDNFIWIGFIDNPHNIVKQCDYSVLLCDEETWGLVLTEAMIVGVPCISTDFEAAYEQIENRKNGIILSRYRLDCYEDEIDEIVSNKNKYKEAVTNYKYDNDKILNQWYIFLNQKED